MTLPRNSLSLFNKAPAIRFTTYLFAFFSLLFISACGKEKKAGPPPAPDVEVAEVIRKDIPIIHEWVGTADGLVNATIRAQVTGYLIRQAYHGRGPGQKGAGALRNRPAPFPGRAGPGAGDARPDGGAA